MTDIADHPPTELDTAESRLAVAELRSTRRRRRLGDTDWGELAYRVYTTAFFCLVVTIMISGWIGNSAVEVESVGEVASRGPAWAGLVLAVVLLAAVRSGSRGGPLSLERADVQHLLLAPVSRTATLRRPTLSVLGYGVATGMIVVAVVGSLFAQRLPGGDARWVASGALFGLLLAATALGSALSTCSRIVPALVPMSLAALLVLWALGDVADRLPTAPTTFAGDIFFWPITPGGLGLTWLGIAVVAVLVGVTSIGGLSVEKARRRTDLVGQLRFAVTLQDLRSVVLLRRQLASELPRNRTWFRVPRSFTNRFPVTARDLRSVAHWPPIRVARVLVLALGAALAVRAMWSGNLPLVVVAGLASFVAALDATEALSQEVDHPTLAESLPVPTGTLLVRHLVQPCIVLVVAGTVALGVLYALDPAPQVLEVGAMVVVTASLSAVAGAAVSIVSSMDSGGGDMLMTPEVAGPRLVFRTAWPPLVAMIGFLPALAASRVGERSDPASVAASLSVLVLLLVAAVFGWVRFRSDIHRSMAESMPGGTDARGATG